MTTNESERVRWDASRMVIDLARKRGGESVDEDSAPGMVKSDVARSEERR